jgi:hypothetical protein
MTNETRVKFRDLHYQADLAGAKAAEQAHARWVQAVDPDGTRSEAFPICGFAWVSFAGNTAWGRWAKEFGLARKHYPKGLCIWISRYNQSYDFKMAYAKAYAETLRANGIDAHYDGRLD